MVGDPLQANISAAPALQRVADIVSGINQRAWMSAPGRQEELANIQRWQAGELDPSIYAQEATQAAQTYGGGGFGVDSPAWQAAIQRALVTNRQALQEKGAAALGQFYEGMPTTDVTRFTLTPSDYAAAMDAQRARQLQLSELQQKGALETAGLAQQRALAEQELALKRQQYQQDVALRQQELDLRRAEQAATLASKGFSSGGYKIPYGLSSQGQSVPYGKYTTGYFDRLGRFHATA